MKIHNIKNEQQHKNLLEVPPSKYHRCEFLTFDYKFKKINTFQNISIKIM